MIENNLLDTPGTQLNEEAKSNLKSVAEWGYYYAIINFVALAVSVITTFINETKFDLPGSRSRIISALVIAGVQLLLNITLLIATTNIKKGIASANQGTFDLGLSKLATYFHILGIVLIVVISIALLILLVAIAAAGGRG